MSKPVKMAILDCNFNHLCPDAKLFLRHQDILCYRDDTTVLNLALLEDCGEKLPESLDAVYQFARKADCHYVNFDIDGTRYPELSVFEPADITPATVNGKRVHGVVINPDDSVRYLNSIALGVLQQAVGGYIELVTLAKIDLVMYVNEEGRWHPLPPNPTATSLLAIEYGRPPEVPVFGSVVICGAPDDDGQDTPITNADLVKLRELGVTNV